MTERLYAQDAYLQSCQARVTAADEQGIYLDQTVFYAMGGGQPGDSGQLLMADGSVIRINDTRATTDGQVLHILTDLASQPSIGAQVTATIDWERRYKHMRLHTCLHLLCAVVDAPVTGGSIGAERARLDFDVPEPILDKTQITAALNQLIVANHPVRSRWISETEMDARPELVKTMSVQPPRGQGDVRLLEIEGVDLQACGGTHVAQTGEIGPVKVAKIEKKSRLNRRVIVTFAEA